MGRKKRIWYPGAIYHVMSSGNRRGPLFAEESDYLSFLEYVSLVKHIYPFKIHSCCLMTNHFHVLMESQDDSLPKIMQKILYLYSVAFNRKYHFTGHVFESRYTGCLIENERYFLEVSRYIHLNPVKAMMVKEPLAYEYSSYHQFVEMSCDDTKAGDCGRKVRGLISNLVDTSKVLGFFQPNSREQYRMFVEGRISHADHELLIQKDINEDELWLPR